jgi:hypothetical protein
MKRRRLPKTGKSEYGYYCIPKTEFPSKQVIEKLPLKPLDLKKYRKKRI